MKSVLFSYPIHEVAEVINWTYFFHAWGLPPRYASIANIHGCDSCRAMWLASFPEVERARAAEAMQLFKDAERMLHYLDGQFETKALCRLCEANTDGDNLLLEGLCLPLLRQQIPSSPDKPYLCLSDFVHPLASDVKDCVGVFATTVDERMLSLFSDDPYKKLLIQTLADRLAEATAETLHAYVRRTMWGYAPDEQLTVSQLHREEFQGIRPAIGYPSLPDQSVNFILDELLDMKKIGISLTDYGAMCPHASVSGLMISHSEASYFSVGKISDEQFTDYVNRRGLPEEEMRKYLADIL